MLFYGGLFTGLFVGWEKLPGKQQTIWDVIALTLDNMTFHKMATFSFYTSVLCGLNNEDGFTEFKR